MSQLPARDSTQPQPSYLESTNTISSLRHSSKEFKADWLAHGLRLVRLLRCLHGRLLDADLNIQSARRPEWESCEQCNIRLHKTQLVECPRDLIKIDDLDFFLSFEVTA